MSKSKVDTPFITDYDVHLFAEGNHYRIFEKLGAHEGEENGTKGTYFSVWAPGATAVSVLSDLNGWKPGVSKMERVGGSGLWSCFVPGIGEGMTYKYFIDSNNPHASKEKSDPYGFGSEVRPRTASVVTDLSKHVWKDTEWMEKRAKYNSLTAPISIYEVHLGSWMRVPEEENRWMTYRELADKLTKYVKDMNFTHVEFMPIAEYPLDLSWGYQTVGYFAPTSRYGTPEDFMFLIDTLHQNDIGVIIDWVPSHFPKDGHGLGMFDGSHLYEHADPRQGEHKEWGTYVFNYGRYEVSNFLISNALFWLEKYHIDGLRVDAVASMLYLDYDRKDGEWVANDYGGRENIEAINFLRRLNERMYLEHPDTMTIAEESTAWGGVSKPTYLGGLGFGFKWDMGWMHDTLEYMSHPPIFRKFHHNALTFRGLYAFSENFVLALSHDEVVYGKGSLVRKMPNDPWQQLANLRLLFGYMYTVPGKKLVIMGSEIGQWNEWYFESSLDWHLLQEPLHQGVQSSMRDLNKLYRTEAALHESDCNASGFEWIDCNDVEQSVLSYIRHSQTTNELVVVICNFTPVPRHNYMIGVPVGGFWEEIMNTDAAIYGGSGHGNFGGVEASPVQSHGRSHTLVLTLPPLSTLVLKPSNTSEKSEKAEKKVTKPRGT